MKDYKKHKFKFNPYLEKLYQSDEPLIIYKVKNGYNIYTLFKKTILNTKNIYKFFRQLENKKYKKQTDLMIGFSGMNFFANYRFKNIKTKKIFHKGIFYKPETIIKNRKYFNHI